MAKNKPTITKQLIIDYVLLQMIQDIRDNKDVTAIDELLHKVPKSNLLAYLTNEGKEIDPTKPSPFAEGQPSPL